MADNYLENHYEEYLKRKAAWEKKKKAFKRPVVKPQAQSHQTPDEHGQEAARLPEHEA